VRESKQVNTHIYSDFIINDVSCFISCAIFSFRVYSVKYTSDSFAAFPFKNKHMLDEKPSLKISLDTYTTLIENNAI
jgi:hypothetical protein